MDWAAVLKLPSTPMQKSLICFTTVCAAREVLPSPAHKQNGFSSRLGMEWERLTLGAAGA